MRIVSCSAFLVFGLVVFPLLVLAGTGPSITQFDTSAQIVEGGKFEFMVEADGGTGSCSLELHIKPAGADDSTFVFIASVSGSPDKTLSGFATLASAQFPAGDYEVRARYTCDGAGGTDVEVRRNLIILPFEPVILEAALTPELCAGSRLDFFAIGDGSAGQCMLKLDIKPAAADDSQFAFIASVSGPGPVTLSGFTTLNANNYPPGPYVGRLELDCDDGSDEVRMDINVLDNAPDITSASVTPQMCVGGQLNFTAESRCGVGNCELALNQKRAEDDDSAYQIIASVSGDPGLILNGFTTLAQNSFLPGDYNARFTYDCDGSPGQADQDISVFSLVPDPQIDTASVSPLVALGDPLEIDVTTSGGLGSCEVVLEAKPVAADDSQFVELQAWSDGPGQAQSGAIPLPEAQFPPGDYEARFTYACDGSGCDPSEFRAPFTIAPIRATFEVTKSFTDGNPGDVTVTLSCNTGLPLEQTKVISPGSPVKFVVTEFDSGELDCEITESVPAGYAATYFDGTSNSADGCAYENVMAGGAFECMITNTPLPIAVTVAKAWVYEGADPGDIDDRFSVRLTCDAEIEGGVQSNGWWYRDSGTREGNASIQFSVHPTYLGNRCDVTEQVVLDWVESDTSGCRNLAITLGADSECTVVNTVFFESIPALGSTGRLVLLLLVLGVGAFAIRRVA